DYYYQSYDSSLGAGLF
nr:immunoglobulin light chain junction region [Macaca mulatta]